MYITVSELGIPEDVLIRLTDDEGSGSVNEGRAGAAVAAAQALVDSALSRQYDVPLSSPGELVMKLVSDIALYNLYMRVGSMPESVKARYEDAAAMLDKFARGVLSLTGAPPDNGPGLTGQDREFSRARMEGF